MKKKLIVCLFGLATIGLAISIFIPKFESLVKYYSEFQEVFIMFLVFFESVDFFISFLSVILFFMIYRRNPINTVMYEHFKKLSFKKKIFFAWFTIIFAIPNKIIINNRLPNFLTSFIIFLIIVISSIFPIFILFYVIFWLSVIESYLFAIFYEERESFKKFIDSKLFENNPTFNKDYFSFFWGNMKSGGAGKSSAGLIGTLVGGLYIYSQEHEKKQLRIRTQQELAQHVANSQHKPQTPQESFQLQKEIEDHIIERDFPILSTEKMIKNGVKTFFDYINS